jgi:hypothetical protein
VVLGAAVGREEVGREEVAREEVQVAVVAVDPAAAVVVAVACCT